MFQIPKAEQAVILAKLERRGIKNIELDLNKFAHLTTQFQLDQALLSVVKTPESQESAVINDVLTLMFCGADPMSTARLYGTGLRWAALSTTKNVCLTMLIAYGVINRSADKITALINFKDDLQAEDTVLVKLVKSVKNGNKIAQDAADIIANLIRMGADPYLKNRFNGSDAIELAMTLKLSDREIIQAALKKDNQLDKFVENAIQQVEIAKQGMTLQLEKMIADVLSMPPVHLSVFASTLSQVLSPEAKVVFQQSFNAPAPAIATSQTVSPIATASTSSTNPPGTAPFSRAHANASSNTSSNSAGPPN